MPKCKRVLRLSWFQWVLVQSRDTVLMDQHLE